MSIKYVFVFFFLTEKMVMKMVMVNVSGESKTILILSPTGPSYSPGSTGRSSCENLSPMRQLILGTNFKRVFFFFNSVINFYT